MTVAPGLFASSSHMASAPSSAELGAAGAGASGPCAARSSAPRLIPKPPARPRDQARASAVSTAWLSWALGRGTAGSGGWYTDRERACHLPGRGAPSRYVASMRPDQEEDAGCVGSYGGGRRWAGPTAS